MNSHSPKVQSAIIELRKLFPKLTPKIGDRLPAERNLTHEIGCSRETLRRALAALEDEGELWRHVGQGTFRGRRPVDAPFQENLRIHATSVEEFVQARLLIEPMVAGEAARHATHSDVKKLQACVRNGRQGHDSFECQQADDLFHRTIAEAAKNSIISSVLTFLSETRRRSVWQNQWDQTYREIGIKEFKIEHSNQHQHIVDAIADHDAETAEFAMRHHLETIKTALKIICD